MVEPKRTGEMLSVDPELMRLVSSSPILATEIDDSISRRAVIEGLSKIARCYQRDTVCDFTAYADKMIRTLPPAPNDCGRCVKKLTMERLRQLIEYICRGRRECSECPISTQCGVISECERPDRWVDEDILRLALMIFWEVK